MGATLNVSSGMNAYALTDRATWVAFGNKGELGVLVEGDPRLFNQYGIILVNPEKHPHVKADEGRKFIDWMQSPEGQAAIADAVAIEARKVLAKYGQDTAPTEAAAIEVEVTPADNAVPR